MRAAPVSASRRAAAPGRRWIGILVVACVAAGCGDAGGPVASVPLGEPLDGLTEAERGRFLLGRALFERIATPEEGLGPLFNAERCSSCHDDPVPGGAGAGIPVLKVSRFDDGVCSTLPEAGGDNLQQRVTPMLQARGLGPEPIPDRANGSVHVTAPPLFGLGLLEAVPEAELVARADPSDADGDGISGRVPRRPDGTVVRFGRKGDASNVQDFVEQALLLELGFTSPRFPREEGHSGVALPADVDPFPDPEMTPEAVTLITDFVRYLAPPSPDAGIDPEEVAAGRRLFEQAGCTDCHTPELRTGDAPEDALSDVVFEAYTDLLLHDMGDADGDVCTPQANPGEYRTPSLWGLRHRTTLLHDGRATTLTAAIEAHGGEGAASRDAFLALSPEQRARILGFLSGL
jgi:CxxC motif-containing protein (DUF1111 family)